MIDFARDVQEYLQAQGIVDSPTSWTSTSGPFRDQPDRMVQIGEDAGPAPEISASAGMGYDAFTFPAVLVTVRGRAYERMETRTKAEEIYDTLEGLQGATLDSQAYLIIRARTSQFAVVLDAKQRPQFSMGYVATAAAVA